MDIKQPVNIKFWLRTVLPIAVGAAGGFMYYTYVGCVTGTCALTSNPVSSVILGAFFGAAFIPSPWKKKNTVNTEKEENK